MDTHKQFPLEFKREAVQLLENGSRLLSVLLTGMYRTRRAPHYQIPRFLAWKV
jgi:hypothetical protein